MSTSRDHLQSTTAGAGSTFGASSFANRRFLEYEREKERDDAFARNYPNHLVQSNQNPTSNPNIQQHHHYNYVTNEEFALLKRTIERDRLNRDDTITKLKKEIFDLKERAGDLFAATEDDTNHNNNTTNRKGTNTNTNSNKPNVFMSSPPKRFGLFSGSSTNNKSSSSSSFPTESPEEQLSHHLTLQSRVEHLEAATLSFPVQLDAIEEKCRTIVEERIRNLLSSNNPSSSGLLVQMGDLNNKVDALASRQAQSETIQNDISNMLEHDVARNAPIKQSLDEVKLDAALLKKEVDTLHSQRLASEDTRVKLENEVRALRTHLAELETVLSGKLELEIAKVAEHQLEQITKLKSIVNSNNSNNSNNHLFVTETVVEKKLMAERNQLQEFVLAELQKLRDEHELENQNKARIDSMMNNITSTPPPPPPSQQQQNRNRSSFNDEQKNSENGNNSSSQHQQQQQLFNLLSEQIQAKGRQLEANLNAALGDSNRSLESKFSTRIREQAESNRALISEEMSQRMDQQFAVMINTAKEELRHEMSQQLENIVKREVEKKMSLLQSSSSSKRVFNNNLHQNNFAAPDVIFDGVELFVREIFAGKRNNNNNKNNRNNFLSPQQQNLYSQCLELISLKRNSTNNDNADEEGRVANTNDALLLLWTFLRSHLSGFNILADSVGQLSQDFTSLASRKPPQNIEDDDEIILNTVFDDVDAVVSQFSQVNDSFADCGELLERIVSSKNNNAVSSAEMIQVLWSFMRGMLTLFTTMNERIDRM